MAAKSTLFILSVSERDVSFSADPEVKYTGPGRIAPYESVADSIDWYFTSKPWPLLLPRPPLYTCPGRPRS